jgi:hypothetical protein
MEVAAKSNLQFPSRVDRPAGTVGQTGPPERGHVGRWLQQIGDCPGIHGPVLVSASS